MIGTISRHPSVKNRAERSDEELANQPRPTALRSDTSPFFFAFAPFAPLCFYYRDFFGSVDADFLFTGQFLPAREVEEPAWQKSGAREERTDVATTRREEPFATGAEGGERVGWCARKNKSAGHGCRTRVRYRASTRNPFPLFAIFAARDKRREVYTRA